MPDPLKQEVIMLFAPWDFMWPDRRVSVVRETGRISLHPTIAQAAIDAGMAEPVEIKRPKRQASSTIREPRPTLELDDAATLSSETDSMDRGDLADDGGADGELPGEAAE